MGDRRCCCQSCFNWIDYFYRDDSDDLGSNWTEESGDWEIKSNHLYEPGTSGAKAIGTQQVSATSAGEMYVAVTASDFVSGQECELYAAYDPDTGNCWKGTYTKNNSTPGGSWSVSLYKNGVLLDTAADMDPFPWYIDMDATGVGTDTNHVRCWLCVDSDGNAKAGVLSGDEPAWSIENGGILNRKFGVGHTNSIATYLDDFFVSELHDTTHECYACWCSCCGNLLAPRLTATIKNATDRADCLEDESVDLLWEWNGGLQRRSGTLTYVRGIYTNTFELHLSCSSYGDSTCTGQNISLEIISNCAKVGTPGITCSTGGCILTPTMDSTCDPLNLIFGPIVIERGMLACTACYDFFSGPDDGEYYIVVTE